MSLLSAAAGWLIEPPEDPIDARPRRPITGIPEHHIGRSAGNSTLIDVHRSRAATSPLALADDDASLTLASRATAPARIAVLGSPSAVPALAAATALDCRARARVPAALVAVWRSPDHDERFPGPAGGPVLPGAAALASRLARRELPVAARGRIVWLRLPADEAAPTLRRAEAALGDLPAVLAVLRPRDPGVDAVLAERDLLVLAADDGSALACAAAADAASLGVPIRLCRPLPAGALRLAALAGLRGPRLEPAAPATNHGMAPRLEEAW